MTFYIFFRSFKNIKYLSKYYLTDIITNIYNSYDDYPYYNTIRNELLYYDFVNYFGDTIPKILKDQYFIK